MDRKENKNDLSGSFASGCIPTDEILYELKDRALASASEGVVISDPSLPDNPIIYVNSGFEAMTGYTGEEVLGKNCRFLQGPATGQVASEEIRAAIAQDRPCVVELLNYRKDGSAFWNRLSITPVRDAAGKTTHYIGIQTDITPRREAEDNLRRANDRIKVANTNMRRALEYAARIQQALLPPPTMTGKGFKIMSSLKPCDELAGDTLNVFALSDTLIGFYILDVVGHGVPAALLSVSISHLLSPRSGKSCLFESTGPQQKAGRILSPAQVGEVLNEIFAGDDKGQFFTFFYGLWDVKNRQFSYVSAGHPPAIYVPQGGQIGALEAAGYPIGVHSDPAYVNHTLKMDIGDRLFVYTDGLTEIINDRQDQFGQEQLMRLVGTLRCETLEEAMEEIICQAETFGRGVPFQDDVSLIGFEITA